MMLGRHKAASQERWPQCPSARPFSIKPLLAALVLVAATSLSAAANAQSVKTPESYVLDNGLTVVIAPDHKVPKVAVTLQYRVGVVNEPVGRSGFAHLFEHLMFAGTPAYPNIDTTLSALGLAYNASTGQDATRYFASGLASTLPVILSVQADKMANIGAAVTETDLDLQRSVVLNEMRQNVLDAPGGAALTALHTGMFPADHPYHRAVIGSIADIEAATIEDVRAFFNAYYVPGNAVLAIVGDVDVAATKVLIDDTFGRIAPGVDVPVPVPAETTPTRVRLETTDAVASPTVYVGFSGPATYDAEDAALFMAGDMLSNESGPLRDLVNEGVATFAAGGWAPGDLGGKFTFFAGAGAGITAEVLEERLRATIADFVAAPIDPPDLERSRSAFVLSYRTALEGFSPRSQRIASEMSSNGDITGVLDEAPAFTNVTAADVERAMRDILVDADASVAIIRPGARGDYPAVLREPSGEAEPFAVPDRAPVTIPVLSAGEPEAAILPSRETAALSNGIRLVHYRMEGAPMAYLAVAVTGGHNNDPRGKEGIYELAIQMGTRGAGERDEEQFAEASRDIGGMIGMWSGMSSSGALLSVVPENLAGAVDLLADVVQEPRFDAEPWAVLKAQTMQYLVQRESDLDSAAYRALNRVIYSPGPDDAAIDLSMASVEGMTREEALAIYEALFVPRTMIVYSVSDLSIDAVIAALEPRFGAWHEPGAGVVPKPPLQPAFPDRQRIYVVPVPGVAQTLIQISRPAPGSDDAEYAEAIAVTNLLFGDFSSRLNTVIREQKGYSYGVGGYLWSWLRHDGGLTVSIPVQGAVTNAALGEALSGFETLASVPVSEAELGRSLMSYLSAQASLPETAGGFFGALVGWEKDGVELDSLIGFLKRMTELDLDEVRDVAASLAGLDRAVIVLAGDPDAIVSQLSAMGITDAETIDLAAPVAPAK